MTALFHNIDVSKAIHLEVLPEILTSKNKMGCLLVDV
jgi:hypothetical protein